MEEEELRRRSAPRPWPTGGWFMNYHIYSSAVCRLSEPAERTRGGTVLYLSQPHFTQLS
jgi:hypothetical protein